MFKLAVLMCALSFAAGQILPKTRVVIINGVPGAGKTTTRKALQKQSRDAFIWVGFDLILDQLPQAFNHGVGKKLAPEEYDEYHQYDRYIRLNIKEGKGHIVPGADCFKMHRAVSELFRIFLENRCNLVVDGVFGKSQDLIRYTGYIDPEKTDVYLIKLEVKPDILVERHLNRDGVELVVLTNLKGIVYDLTLRTDELTPEQAAAAIIDHIVNNPPSAVFDPKNKIEFRY